MSIGINLLIFVVVNFIQAVLNIWRQKSLVFDGGWKALITAGIYYGFDVFAKALLVLNLDGTISPVGILVVKAILVGIVQMSAWYIYNKMDSRTAAES